MKKKSKLNSWVLGGWSLWDASQGETPSDFKATQMFFNIHLVSYFIDEDTVMFLWSFNSEKNKPKTSFILLLNLQPQFLSRTREAVAVQGTCWWKIKENVYVMRCCQYWMWSDRITLHHLSVCESAHWFLRLLLAVFWRSSVRQGPVLMAAASIPHMTDECCPLRLYVSHRRAQT